MWVGLGWWWVVKCFFLKKGGEGGAGGQAVGKARRMCHRAGKVQGYRRQHCSRIREWRSQAKLCCEPTMCVREGERKRVRAGGGARAGEGRGEGGGAGAELPGGKAFAALLPCRTAARPLRPASDPPRVDSAAGAAGHSPRKGSEGPPEKNPKRSIPLGCKLLFSVLGPIPPPSLAFFP